MSFADTILNDPDEEVQKAALNYLANSGSRLLLSLLDETSLRHDSLGRSARIAALRLKIFVDPVAALTEVSSSSSTVSTEVLGLLEERAANIPSALLVQTLENADRGIRGFAARALLNRGELTIDCATQLVTDESFKVRQIGLEVLVQQGTQLSPDDIAQYLKDPSPAEGQGSTLASLLSGRDFVDPERVIEKLFETYSEDKLNQEIGWYKSYSALAYGVLARKYFATNRDRIHHDLATHFQDIRQKFIEGMQTALRREHGLTVEQRTHLDQYLPRYLAQEYAKVDEFIEAKYTAAALAGIARHGDATDAPMVRKFLETNEPTATLDDIRLQGLKYLGRFGSATDAELALQVAKTSPLGLGGSVVREEALKTAVALAPGITGIATELLQSDDMDFVRAGVGAIWNEDPDMVKRMLFPLLQHSKTELRRLAIAYFIRRYPRERLEGILQESMELSTYYYNVICWLDRALYSPAALASGYQNRLQNDIGDLGPTGGNVR